MEKENKRRIGIYVFVIILSTLCALVGIYGNITGHGKKGAAKKELVPLVTEFENTVEIAELKASGMDLTTDINNLDGTIVVTFIDINNRSYNYEFKFKVDDDLRTITCTYKFDDPYAEKVMKAMINAVYQRNGGSDSVFDHYPYSTFTKTTVEQGINVKGGSNTTVTINLKENIVKNIEGVDLNKDNFPYVTNNDLTNMLQELELNNEFVVKKGTITIYVVDLGFSYNIYAENKSNEVNDDLYNSLLNVIKVLYESTYDVIVDSKDRLNRNNKTDRYEVNLRATLFNKSELFDSSTDLLQIIIYKV